MKTHISPSEDAGSPRLNNREQSSRQIYRHRISCNKVDRRGPRVSARLKDKTGLKLKQIQRLANTPVNSTLRKPVKNFITVGETICIKDTKNPLGLTTKSAKTTPHRENQSQVKTSLVFMNLEADKKKHRHAF